MSSKKEVDVTVFTDSDSDSNENKHRAASDIDEHRPAKKQRSTKKMKAAVNVLNLHKTIGSQNTARSEEPTPTYFSDGTQLKMYEDGSVETIYPNETQIINYPSGRILRNYPDGRQERFFPNGRIEKLYPENHEIEYETKDENGNKLTMWRNGDYKYKKINGYTQIQKNGEVETFSYVNDDSAAAPAAAASAAAASADVASAARELTSGQKSQRTNDDSVAASAARKLKSRERAQRRNDDSVAFSAAPNLKSRQAAQRRNQDFTPISAITFKIYKTLGTIKKTDINIYTQKNYGEDDLQVVRVLVDNSKFPRAVEWKGQRKANDGALRTVWLTCTLEIWTYYGSGNKGFRVVITTKNESTVEDRKNLVWDTIVETFESGRDPIETESLNRVVPEDVDKSWKKDDFKNKIQAPFTVKDNPSEAQKIVFEEITNRYNCLWLPIRRDTQKEPFTIFGE